MTKLCYAGNAAILFQIWEMSDPEGKGFLDRKGLFVACKMVALVQCDQPLTVDNARVACKAPNFGPETAPGAPTASGAQTAPLPAKTAINFLVKPEEKRKYDTLFEQLQPQDGKVTGDKVSRQCHFIRLYWHVDPVNDKEGLLEIAAYSSKH